LKGLKFEKGGAREQELTFAHVTAFIRAALDLGARGSSRPNAPATWRSALPRSSI
jgi:hypothetical protein